MDESDLDRRLADDLVLAPAEDALGLRGPALHAQVRSPFDDAERRVLDVGRDLLERAPEGVVRALELLHLERAREDTDHFAGRVAMRVDAHRDPVSLAVRIERLAFVVNLFARERALNRGCELRVGVGPVELGEAPADDLLARRAEPLGEAACDESHNLVAIHVGDERADAIGKSFEE